MSEKLQFGVYELDIEGLELKQAWLADSIAGPAPQGFGCVVGRPGEIVTREQLQERIWGKDTFVDFDQSLNKAVNRLREALNDDPAQPQYLETVPRRGYRFIAPVSPGLRSNGRVIPEQAASGKSLLWLLTRSRIPVLGVTAACLVAIAAVLLFSHRSPVRIPQEPVHMSSFGVKPALSRDGRLLAYAASLDGGLLHIWGSTDFWRGSNATDKRAKT